MILALVSAGTAALAYGAATILQALGVRAARNGSGGSAKRRAGLLYASGIAMDGVGFVAQAYAAHDLPLFLVQAVTASSVAITAILAVIVLKSRLTKVEVIALVAVGCGLVALASAASDGPPHRVPSAFGACVLISAALVATLGGWGWRRRSAGLLAFAAGLGFSGIALAARIITWDHWTSLLTNPAAWALVLHGVLASVLYALALDAGEATAVAAMNFGTETVVPSAVGVWILGDHIRHGLTGLMLAGFVVTLGGCLALAQRSEPAE